MIDLKIINVDLIQSISLKMDKKRKIALVAKQYSLKEAEDAEDHYRAIASVDERFAGIDRA